MNKKNSNYCTFYIIRHGETEWNVKGLVQGWEDSPLTSLGEDQAQQLATKLKPVVFDKVFSSDLLRAKKTAEIIVENKGLTIQTITDLREQNFGPCVGTKREDFLKLFIGWHTLSFEEKFNYKVVQEAESDKEAVTRFINFLKKTAAENLGKVVLVVCHGGLMRYLLICLGWADYETLERVTNTAYIKLSFDKTNFVIEEIEGITKKQDSH